MPTSASWVSSMMPVFLRLQAFPLPRPNLFTSDLARMVAQVQAESAIVATALDLAHLEALIHADLHLDDTASVISSQEH